MKIRIISLVTLIVPQLNSPEFTLSAIRSLRQHDPTPWSVLVVDNGSSPTSVRALHALDLPHVEIMSLPQPGLTAAWNAAAVRTSSQTLVFLNNDTQSRGSWVEALIDPLLNGDAMLTGVEARRETQLSPPVDLLAGWCLAVNREAFLSVGGFDESMGLYFSDTDLQLRLAERYPTHPARLVRGLPLVHDGHRTTSLLPERRALWAKDRERFIARWRS